MTNTNLLNAQITKNGFTREEVAKTLEISLTSLWKKINNKVEFKASEIYILRKTLNIHDSKDVDEIFFCSQC